MTARSRPWRLALVLALLGWLGRPRQPRPLPPLPGPAVHAGRLLVVTSNYPRWAGDSTTPFVLDLTRELGERGWAADVLAPHAPGAARDEDLGGIPVHRFRYLLPESAQTVCYQGGALVNLRQEQPFILGLASDEAAARALLLAMRYEVPSAPAVAPPARVPGG